jgi:hypothetical protein
MSYEDKLFAASDYASEVSNDAYEEGKVEVLEEIIRDLQSRRSIDKLVKKYKDWRNEL